MVSARFHFILGYPVPFFCANVISSAPELPKQRSAPRFVTISFVKIRFVTIRIMKLKLVLPATDEKRSAHQLDGLIVQVDMYVQ